MKTITLYGAGILLLLGSCKKEEDGNPAGGSIGYTLRAPSCLVTNIQSDFGTSTLTYDNQKRLIRQASNNDSYVITYSYVGNKLYETQTEQLGGGSTESKEYIHYLNYSGFIDSTVEEGRNTVRVYLYNPEGYLVYQLDKLTSGYPYGGKSYQYLGGNRISEYILRTNQANGAIIDSSLSLVYTYYSNSPTQQSDWEAWITRRGRGNSNSIKAVQSASEDIATISYIYNSSGYPTQLT